MIDASHGNSRSSSRNNNSSSSRGSSRSSSSRSSNPVAPYVAPIIGMTQQLGIPQQNNIQLPNQSIPQQQLNQAPLQQPIVNIPGPLNEKSIVELDIQKALQLIADIKTLEENHRILSSDIRRELAANFNITYVYKSFHPSSYIIKMPDLALFDPCREIINPLGGFLRGMPIDISKINPYTGKVVVIDDLPMLQAIRSFIKRLVYLEISFLGLNDACKWNINQMKRLPDFNLLSGNKNPGDKTAYGFNLIRPYWLKGLDFIAGEDFVKKAYMNIQQMNTMIQQNVKNYMNQIY